MNRNGLITSLMKVLSTKKEARNTLETIFSVIKTSLKNGDKVIISGFGSFLSSTMKAKNVRNPKTGQMMSIAPRKKIRFRQSKDFFS